MKFKIDENLPAERAVLVAERVAGLDGDEPEDQVEAAWADEVE